MNWFEKFAAETSVTLAYRLIFAGILIGCAYLAWLYWSKPSAPVGIATIAQPAKQIKDVPKEELHPRVVVVYAPPAKAKLDLPPAVIQNTDQQVIASTRVSADDHPHTVTQVFDASTGQTQTYDVREPLPWLQVKKSGAIGIEHDLFRGVDTLYVRDDFIQAKSLVLGGKLAYNSERSLSGTVSLEWRW